MSVIKIKERAIIPRRRDGQISRGSNSFSGSKGSSDSSWMYEAFWGKVEIPNLDKLRIDEAGNLIVPGNIIAFGSSDYIHDMIAAMPVASLTSKGLAQFSDTQFTVVNGVVSIKSGVAGLDESALASYLNSHSYATESFVTSRGYLTAHQSLSHLALKTHLHSQYLTSHQSLSGYYSKVSGVAIQYNNEINSNGSRLQIGYRNTTEIQLGYDGTPVYVNRKLVATQPWVDSKGYLTAHQSIANLALKNHLHSQYLTAHQSLSGYYSKQSGIALEYSNEINSTSNSVLCLGYRNTANISIGNSGAIVKINRELAATQPWVGSRGYLTSHQSLSHLALLGGSSLHDFKVRSFNAYNVSKIHNAENVNQRITFYKGMLYNYDDSAGVHIDLYLNGYGNILATKTGTLQAVRFASTGGALDFSAHGIVTAATSYLRLQSNANAIYLNSLLGVYFRNTDNVTYMSANPNGTFTTKNLVATNDIYMNAASTTGGYARGLSFRNKAGTTIQASFGMKGNSDILQYLFMGGTYSHHNIRAYINGATELYYGSYRKLITTSTGISITGTITGTGNVTAFSDMRLKDFKKPLDNVLNNINKLSTFYYHWKDKEKYGSDLHLGLSAQTVDLLFPEFVNHGEILSLDYGKLGAVLAVKGLQEVKHWMSKSDKRILELEKEVNKLNKRLGYVA